MADISGILSIASTLEVEENTPLEDLPERCEERLRELVEVLGVVPSHSDHAKVASEVVADVLLVSASHSGQHYWSNGPSRKLAKELTVILMHMDGCSTVEELVCGLMKHVVVKLKTKLTRGSWKKHPSAKQAMVWCLKRLSHPNVSPHLDFFFPACLLLLDDHESQNKVLGLSAIRHIISNVDASELRWYGRAGVLYQAVQTMLYTGEEEVVRALHPTLVELLPVVDSSSGSKQKHANEVFAILLNSLDVEPKTAMRKAYIAHVSGYIKLLGINSVRHMKVLLRVLYSCLEFPDYSGEHTRKWSLEALVTLMQHAWPRVPCHKQTILKALLQLISDVYPVERAVTTTNQKLVGLIVECLVLLGQCCDDMKQCYGELRASSTHKGLTFCLTQALRELCES